MRRTRLAHVSSQGQTRRGAVLLVTSLGLGSACTSILGTFDDNGAGMGGTSVGGRGAGTGGTSGTTSSGSGGSGGSGTSSGSGGSIPLANAWYVRPNGGTRSQCTGRADADYQAGSGVQACAFNDFRLLYDDHTSSPLTWVIAAGDAVVVRGGPWRVGFDQGASATDAWCVGQGGADACTPPPIPSGTAAQHTRILGENYASCAAASARTQLHGGYGIHHVLSLAGSAYVDVQCLELTDHSPCSLIGTPLVSPCSAGYPYDDFAQSGLETSVGTHDVTLEDLDIHGFPFFGILGHLGGVVTATRVRSAYNGADGWSLDDGTAGPGNTPDAAINASYLTLEWNGCNEQYPIVSTNPAVSCYDGASGGDGEGLDTANPDYLSFSCDHCVARYNTKSGIDTGHVGVGTNTLKITNSTFVGNMATPLTSGPNETTVILENNLVLANCARMAQAIPGTPSTFNQYLTQWCRSKVTWSFSFLDGSTARIANNTVVAYEDLYQISCGGTGNCPTSTLTLQNNLHLAYADQVVYADYGGQAHPATALLMPGGGTMTEDHNIFFNFRNCGGAGDLCTMDPLFVGEPSAIPELTAESLLDDFNFMLDPTSPARGAGVAIPGLTTNYAGTPTPSPPDIGAY